MTAQFDFLSPNDKPALVAISDPELQTAVRDLLAELEYKVHVINTHPEFDNQFSQVQYQVVVIDENFASNHPSENVSLKSLQNMQGAQRRHATTILIGDNFETLNGMEAFQQSVHAVLNRAEAANFGQYFLKAISDHNLFMSIYRDVQNRIASGAK